MGLHVGDDPSLVVENRKRFFDALGADSRTLINCSQVHGTHIEIVGKEDCGRGALSLDTAIPDTDGLITNEANVPITMNYADCTPLFSMIEGRHCPFPWRMARDSGKYCRKDHFHDGKEIWLEERRYPCCHRAGHRSRMLRGREMSLKR